MQNRQNVYIYEFILLIAILVSLLIDILTINEQKVTTTSKIVYVTVILILVLMKLQKEGPRTPFLFIIMNHIMLLISKHFEHQNYLLLSIVIFLSVLSTVLLVLMPVFAFPKTTGIYAVGFKEFLLEGTPVSVYYPVDRELAIKKFQKSRHIRRRKYIEELCFAYRYYFNMPIPLKLCQAILGFLYKTPMEVLVENYKNIINQQSSAPMSSDLGKALPVIFSNGILGLRDHYSCILRELASQGHVIFAPQADEVYNPLDLNEMKMIRSDSEDSKLVLAKIIDLRQDQLTVRVKKIERLIDWIHSEKNVKDLLGSSSELNLNKLIGAGHSFGGCTMYEVCVRDSRLNGGLIMYDPWNLPLTQKSLMTDIKLPILSITSESFKKIQFNKVLELSSQMFQSQRSKPYLSVELIGSDHMSQTDLTFLMPGEMLAFKELRQYKNITQVAVANLALTNIFINKALKCHLPIKEVDQVLKKYDEFIKKQFKHKHPIYLVDQISK